MMDHRKFRELIASSALISIVSFILACVSFSSQNWINAKSVVAYNKTQAHQVSLTSYGLFKGKLIRSLTASSKIYNLHFTCAWEKNSCAWSCLDDHEARLAEVEALIDGQKPAFSCQPMMTFSKTIPMKDYSESLDATVNGELLNAGMNLSTILLVFLTISSLFICAILGVLNYEKCPKTELLNLPGIIVSSMIAFIFNLVGLVVYGCYYDYWIRENIGILDTLVGEYKSYANLGFGYWLFMGSCFLNPISIFVLYIRNVLLVIKQRSETIITVARVNDPTGVAY